MEATTAPAAITKRLAFTKATLQRLACPAGRDRVYVYDARTSSLAFCVTATGRRSFYLIRRVDGRPQRYRLGGFPDLSVEQARTKAQATNGDIARGVNPQAVRHATRAQMTLAAAFRLYVDRHGKLHKKTWHNDELQFDRHLAKLGTRPLSSIDRETVSALHARVGGKHGPYAANRLIALLSAVFNFADAELHWRGGNPARRLKRFREQKRERFLRRDELPRFFDALDAEPNHTVRDLLYVAILTGARRGNVQAMRWAEVHLDDGTWNVPDTKAGEPQTVYLPPEAVEILKRRACGLASDYVFPGRGRSRHLVEPKSAWRSILKRAGITGVRPHDLRRTLGSWQTMTGASLQVIGKTLGHKSTAATAIYARLNLDPVRASVDAAVGAMMTTRNVTEANTTKGESNGKAK